MNELIGKGRAAYRQMEEACSLLVSSGNWQRVGTSDIRLFLDMYVQALLLKMAQANGSVSGDMKRFIAEAPARDVLSIGKALSGEAALNIGHKNRSFAEGTPLLLRCCVAMDDKDGTSSAQQFVAGVSQLLYAAADVDGGLTGNQLSFITGYLGGLRTFLLTRAAGRHASGAQEATRRADIPAQEGKSGAKKQESARPAPETAKKEEPEKTIEELMAELDSLIGLDGVKREVRSLINLIKVRKMREQHDLKVMDMSFHMVFTGNPGTGKTTVARLVAKIYKQLGFLSKGQLIETDRSGLVAGYVGQTAGKVTEVVSSALGGILFIDEAYALARKGMDNDFGREAIDTLVKLMEDNRDDLVVIVAGYTDEMHDFLTSNPGLISRFNKYIDFPDYTDDELMAILAMNAKKQGYTVSDEANAVVREMLQKMTVGERMDFGNARGMRNTLEKLVQEQANRLAGVDGEITKDMLCEIVKEDAIIAINGEEAAKNHGEQKDEKPEDAGAEAGKEENAAEGQV